MRLFLEKNPKRPVPVRGRPFKIPTVSRSAAGEARRQTTAARLAGRVTGVALGLAFGLDSQFGGDALGFLGLADAGLLGGDAFGFGALGCFTSQLCLLQNGFLGLPLGAGGENRLTLGLAGQNARIVFRRTLLETLEKSLLCIISGVAPLENVFFPVYSQLYFPEIGSRALHTGQTPDFKRQNGMPAMKSRYVALRRHLFMQRLRCAHPLPISGGT